MSIFAPRYKVKDFSQQGYKPKISYSCGQPQEFLFLNADKNNK